MSSENPSKKDWICPDCGVWLQYEIFPPLRCGGPRKNLDEWYERAPEVRHNQVGVKHDDDKPRTDLLPAGALLEVARVLGHGAKKYGENNWKDVQPRSRYVGALLRHVFAWMGGEVNDKESRLNHIYHAACCILFLAQWEHEGGR